MKSISLPLKFAVLGAFALLAACKKDKALPKEVGPTPTTNRNELTKDSMFLYAKEVYLWNDALPTYAVFNPRSFSKSSDNLSNLNQELFAIRFLYRQ